jgi:hypothetical protein
MMRYEPLDPEDMWKDIGISLNHKLEKSKVRVVGNRDMRSREIIWVVGSRGHVVRDQHFIDSCAGEVKGKFSYKFMKCKVPIRSRPLDHRGLWAIDLEQVLENRESGVGRVMVGSRSNTRNAKSRFDHNC